MGSDHEEDGDGMWRIQAVLAVAAFAVAASGCSSVVAGSPVTGSVAPAPDGVDVLLLDPGGYPTRPLPPFGKAGTPEAGATREGQRIADNVVVPFQVDPVFTDDQDGEVFDVAFTDDRFGAGTVAPHQFITGFGSYASQLSGSNHAFVKHLNNIVLRFATSDDATAAAADIAAAGRHDIENNQVPTHPVSIPRYPATAASGTDERPNIDGTPSVRAVTVDGLYVLVQEASNHAAGLDWAAREAAAAELVAATLDLQRPLIEKLAGTPVDQLASLALDPDGLLARTLPRPRKYPSRRSGVYRQHGALHFELNPSAAQAAFTAGGMRQVTRALTHVSETSNTDGARRVREMFVKVATADGYKPVSAIRGLPLATCLTRANYSDTSTFYCVAVADRYVIEASSYQELDAHRLLSAQYLMLTGT
jgi:hypothetical protein